MKIQKYLMAMLLVLLSPFVLAQSPVQVRVTSEKEVRQLNQQGELEVLRVSPETVVPGDTLVFTVEVSNTSGQPTADVVVTDPISSSITYAESSIFSSITAGTVQVTFSVDGGTTYLPRDQLLIQNDSGQELAAVPEDINSIRWQFSEPIPPGEAVQVGFRATVN